MLNSTKLISANINCLWLTKIRPIWLREKFFWKLYDQTTNFLDLFEQVAIEFFRQIKLKLISIDIGHKQIASLGLYELLTLYVKMSATQKFENELGYFVFY